MCGKRGDPFLGTHISVDSGYAETVVSPVIRNTPHLTSMEGLTDDRLGGGVLITLKEMDTACDRRDNPISLGHTKVTKDSHLEVKKGPGRQVGGTLQGPAKKSLPQEGFLHCILTELSGCYSDYTVSFLMKAPNPSGQRRNPSPFVGHLKSVWADCAQRHALPFPVSCALAKSN